MWTTTSLENESDVEQKLIYPLLIEPQPLGLGLPASVIQTKASIRRFTIGKGTDQKLYFPDYLVVELGFPIVVIEAKHPSESVEEGYRQARLYANELNSLFPHSVSPSRYVIATNGVDFWYGHSDQSMPIGKARCSELGPYAEHLAKIVETMNWDQLRLQADNLAQSLRPADLYKPRRLLGGVGVQNEEVGQNAFGATLTAEISSIFNPNTRADRAFIACHGYIPSRRRERYVDPIDKIIRAARPPSEVNSIALEDSSRPTEIIDRLRRAKDLEHKVLLLIGSVGSGKSTFIDHLYEVALPRNLIDATVWCRINMNSAPVSSNEIYNWLRQEIISGCRSALPSDDFDDFDVLQKVFSVEINKFKKGVGKLYSTDADLFARKLGEHIEGIQAAAVENAVDVVDYLERIRVTFRPSGGGFMQDDLLETLAAFQDAHDAIARVSTSLSTDPWFNADRRLPRKSLHVVLVVNCVAYGYFVEFQNGLRGLVHVTEFNGLTASPGDTVQVEILWVDIQRRRMGLRLKSVIAEETGDAIPGVFGTQSVLPLFQPDVGIE